MGMLQYECGGPTNTGILTTALRIHHCHSQKAEEETQVVYHFQVHVNRAGLLFFLTVKSCALSPFFCSQFHPKSEKPSQKQSHYDTQEFYLPSVSDLAQLARRGASLLPSSMLQADFTFSVHQAVQFTRRTLCPLDKWGPGCIYMRGGLESRLPEHDKGLSNASRPGLASRSQD